MPVTNVVSDIDTLTLTIHAEFHAPISRVWQVYADPRQLEKIWGPPSHPATVVDHEFRPGGRVTYFMTGPDGEKYPGYWKMQTVDEPNGFTFLDGFADEDFNPLPDMPEALNDYSFVDEGGRTRATYVATYASAEGLQQVLDMGVVEGSTLAINQVDDLLKS